jgi:hypothetical protein
MRSRPCCPVRGAASILGAASLAGFAEACTQLARSSAIVAIEAWRLRCRGEPSVVLYSVCLWH